MNNLCLSAALAAAAMCASARAGLPSFEQVKAAWRPSDSVLLDRHGEPVQCLRTDTVTRRLEWVPLADVSPALRTALLLSEDKRFYEHSGVDWPAVGSAAFGNLWHSKTRGASTLTMQLAGLLAPQRAGNGSGRGVSAKLRQAGAALQLERQWRKDQILEAYLNLAPFRGELVGIGAMSATLFAKRPSGLDAQEAAMAAALLRAPNARPEAVARRTCSILRQVQEPHGASMPPGHAASAQPPTACRGVDTLAAQALARKTAARLDGDAQLAPHLARLLLPQDTRPEVKSTLDASLQRFARDTLRRQLAELQGRQVEDGAVLVLDNASGDVLAWVGSSGGGLSQAAEVDGVLARRQPGSTLKPFLYELAIERRWLTAASLLDDSPLGLETVAGLYIPQNYDRRFKGPVSVRTALASSLNVPAVRTLVMVSPEAFHQRLQALGLRLREGGGYYGYSLALGSAEVRLADLANAYRALANGGQAGPLRFTLDRPPQALQPAMDTGASFIVADVLADREARALTFGLDNALATRQWTAVKTGTSKDMRDNWCIGFSRRYTVGVWVGNASGKPMAEVSGISGAAPVWRAVMDELQRRDGTPAAPAAPPQGLVRQHLHFTPAVEPPRDEWFIAGTQQAAIVRAAHATLATLIAQPIDHTVLALDPDIPPQSQRMAFTPAHTMPAGWRWRLDGRMLGAAARIAWLPWPGAHRLELVDDKGTVREAVRFEVRGAHPRRAPPA